MKLETVLAFGKVQEFLDAAPSDEVYSERELASAVGLSREVLRRRRDTIRKENIHRHQRRLIYFGHVKAIAALRKGLGVK